MASPSSDSLHDDLHGSDSQSSGAYDSTRLLTVESSSSEHVPSSEDSSGDSSVVVDPDDSYEVADADDSSEVNNSDDSDPAHA